MAAPDQWPQAGNQGGPVGVPQGQPLPQAQPLQPGGQVPQGQPIPQGQPLPQGQPIPQGRPVPQGRPMPQARPGARPQPLAPSGRPVPVKGAARTMLVRERDKELEEEEELTSVVAKNAPPWLVSAVFHMILLIVLGLWFLPQIVRKQITLESIPDKWAEKLGDQLEFDTPLGIKGIEQVEDPVLTPDNLPEVDDPYAAPSKLEIVSPDGFTATSDENPDAIGLALNGRQIGMKKSLLGAYGGNTLTEASVLAGLEWRAKQQRANGSWSLLGPYRNGAGTNEDNPEVATGLALLAFQGNGHTHKEGKFKKNVAAGWKWLLKQQDGTGNFFHEGLHPHPFYTQGICTIAACELYGMTKDEKHKEPAERAIKYCLNSQAPEGGWRYQAGLDSDVSVTGWIVMALQSARMARLEIPKDHFRRVERFLDRSSSDGGTRYYYQKGKEVSLAMTAEAMLCRQYLGWPRNDPRMVEALDWITQDGNRVDFDQKRNAFGPKRNTYYWYYATQVCHHMEGKHWKRWNEVMREALPKVQVKKGRKEAGSWDADLNDPYETHGGRLYATCLCIYMLEVYYRHLPIYSKIYTLMGKARKLP